MFKVIKYAAVAAGAAGVAGVAYASREATKNGGVYFFNKQRGDNVIDFKIKNLTQKDPNYASKSKCFDQSICQEAYDQCMQSARPK